MFKNNVELITLNDGLVKRITKTSANREFLFLGQMYSIETLYGSHVKVYYDSYHREISLLKDKYGRLFLYYYCEEMNFDGGDDRVDETFCLVKDESDADELYASGVYRWGREPYVYKDEADFVSVHEIISRK